MNHNNYKPLYDDIGVLGKPLDPVRFANYKKETEERLSHQDTVNRILKCMKDNENDIDDEDREVFNKILGDHQILNKIVFITDGSHRNHRIWFSKGFFISCDYDNGTDLDVQFLSLPVKDKLNYLKNNYEVIFVQIIEDYIYEDECYNHPEYEPDPIHFIYLGGDLIVYKEE